MAEVALHCPKCHAVMVSLQRDGIVIEQCAVCRGVFLSAPELGRLLDASGSGAVLHLNGNGRQPYEGRHRRI